jgi:hypothetical protein
MLLTLVPRIDRGGLQVLTAARCGLSQQKPVQAVKSG